MFVPPEEARALLYRVDPGHVRWGWPVGLRDGAVLALLAAGLTAAEVSRLSASAITIDRGRLLVQIQRREASLPFPLPVHLGARVLAWMSERRLWGTDGPAFTGLQGPLTLEGLYALLRRHRRRLKSRRKRGARA